MLFLYFISLLISHDTAPYLGIHPITPKPNPNSNLHYYTTPPPLNSSSIVEVSGDAA
jgi:hypothetical protein